MYCCCYLVTESGLFFVTSGTAALQVTLCTGFLRQEYCSRLPFVSPMDLLDPGSKPTSFAGGWILYH